MSAASFSHSSFLQAINAVMLWSVHVQKVPQASEHLCPAKLLTRCELCCACQSICPFIPTDSGMPRTVDAQKYLCASRGSPFQTPPFAGISRSDEAICRAQLVSYSLFLCSPSGNSQAAPLHCRLCKSVAELQRQLTGDS